MILLLRSSTQTRGIRNNNPMNIREDMRTDYDWIGEAAADYDPDFEEFDAPEYGIRAGVRILRTYKEKHGLNTISGIISRWAPETENDTQSYIKSVSQRLSLDENQQLSVGQYPDLVKAIIYHENGVQPYTDNIIQTGVNLGLA